MVCVQIPRDKSLPGKGNFWTLDPQCDDMFDSDNYRRRKRRPRDQQAMTSSNITINKAETGDKTLTLSKTSFLSNNASELHSECWREYNSRTCTDDVSRSFENEASLAEENCTSRDSDESDVDEWSSVVSLGKETTLSRHETASPVTVSTCHRRAGQDEGLSRRAQQFSIEQLLGIGRLEQDDNDT